MLTCGLDEVGTGCLAGPIVSAAVALPIDFREWPLPGVRDSKKTTPRQREKVVDEICAYVERLGGLIGIGLVEVEEINRMGHGKAVQLSYSRAVREVCLFERPKLLIVDGSVGVSGYPARQLIEAKADSRYFTVAAASMVAKRYRDLLMDDLAHEHPLYDWNKNRGYGTPEHVAALRKYGMSPLHREQASTTALRA